MTPSEFVRKWDGVLLKETAASQSHFNDVCALVGHETPVELDPAGEFFTFEASTEKEGVVRGGQMFGIGGGLSGSIRGCTRIWKRRISSCCCIGRVWGIRRC